MTSRQILDGLHKTLKEVDRRLATGELDGSGRFYSDAELARGAAIGRQTKPEEKVKAPAA